MAVFAIQSVASVGPAAVRIVFSTAAKAISAEGADDALNPSNYQLSGPRTSRIIRVAPVTDDPRAFTLFGSGLISAGSWSVLVSGVVAADGTALTSPNVGVFGVTTTQPQDLVNGGADDVTPEKVLKQFLSPAFIGEGWDALVYALSRGDQYLQDTARNAWDQMFLATAEGKYLDRLANESGIERPRGVGMSDAVFRELAVRLSTEKITYKALWEILEVFYGRSAVRAVIETEVDAPYALSNGSQLLIEIDGTPYPVVFSSGDFTAIGQAQAIEVAASITRQLRYLGSQAWASAELNPTSGLYRVAVYSPTLGLTSKIRVIGGLAQFPLRFPTLIATATIGATYSVSVLTDGKARLNFTSATAFLSSVRGGDYVLAQDADLTAANRGTFSIDEVAISWTGSAFLQQVTISNSVAVAQTGPLTVAANDFVFYRPTYTAPSSNGAMISGAENSIRLHLPVTTNVVEREPLEAAYVPKETSTDFGDFSASLGPDGVLAATTTNNHGFAAGDLVLLDNIRPTSYAQALTTAAVPGSAGATGTTAAGRQTIVSAMRSVDSLTARTGAVAVTLANNDILIYGGRDTTTYFSDSRVLRFSGVTQDSANRPVYSYNYFTPSNTGYAATHCGIAPFEANGVVGALIACGQTATNSYTSSVRLFVSSTGGTNVGSFLPVTNSWHSACRSPLLITILDGSLRQQVLLIGGQTNTTAATSVITVFNPAVTGDLSISQRGTDNVSGRSRHAGCALTDALGRPVAALWSGGLAGASFSVTDRTNYISELNIPSWGTDIFAHPTSGTLAVSVAGSEITITGTFPGVTVLANNVLYIGPSSVIAGPALANVGFYRIRTSGVLSTSLVAVKLATATAPVAVSAVSVGSAAQQPLNLAVFDISPSRMAVARYSHRVVDIGGGRALAIGGMGRILSQETTDRLVGEVEMFDVNSGVWNPAGQLRFPRYNPSVFKIGDKIYVHGGQQALGPPPTLPTEIYDIPSGRWSVAPLTSSGTYFEYAANAVSNNVGFMFGGESAVSASSYDFSSNFTPQTITSAFIEGSNFASSAHRVNGLQRIATVPSATTFTISGLPKGDVLNTSTVAGTTPQLAARNTVQIQERYIGPYVWNGDSDPVLTSTESTTVGAISQFGQIGVLTLADASKFPDAPGFLVLRAGYADATYPVPYLSRISNTQLAIDFNYIFPFSYPSGTKVTLLAQKAPGVPEDAQDRGSFYVTNSSAGRVAAEAAVRSAVAAGPDLNVKVLYPNDVGLGSAGYPKTGAQKLSDAVRVWGGDDLTAEVVAAQEEDDIK